MVQTSVQAGVDQMVSSHTRGYSQGDSIKYSTEMDVPGHDQVLECMERAHAFFPSPDQLVHPLEQAARQTCAGQMVGASTGRTQVAPLRKECAIKVE